MACTIIFDYLTVHESILTHKTAFILSCTIFTKNTKECILLYFVMFLLTIRFNGRSLFKVQ